MTEAESAAAGLRVEPRAYRNAIGMFATGVTVVFAGDLDDFHGMTANAVTSVSLEPMLILVCVKKQAHLVQYLERYKAFSINVLQRHQEDLSTYFAGAWKEEAPPEFELSAWHGGPLLADCAAAIGCELHEVLEGGDHWIFVGRVIAVHQNQGPVNPLLFYRGRYRKLAALGALEREEIEDSALWAFPW